MLEENDDRRKVIFETEGVTFNLPKTLDKFFVERLEEIEVEPDKRFVINFRFFHKSKPEVDEVIFDQAIVLKVFFTDEDYSNAENDPDKINLFYRLADDKEWISVRDTHGLEINLYDEPVGVWIGEGKTSITEFKDPVIVWGM